MKAADDWYFNWLLSLLTCINWHQSCHITWIGQRLCPLRPGSEGSPLVGGHIHVLLQGRAFLGGPHACDWDSELHARILMGSAERRHVCSINVQGSLTVKVILTDWGCGCRGKRKVWAIYLAGITCISIMLDLEVVVRVNRLTVWMFEWHVSRLFIAHSSSWEEVVGLVLYLLLESWHLISVLNLLLDHRLLILVVDVYLVTLPLVCLMI